MSFLKKFRLHVDRLFVKPEDECDKQLHAAIGIAGEAGEILDTIKKHWVYGAPLDHENILEECGDILFYVQALLEHTGLTMEQAIDHNIEKLNKRYPDGYADERALDRLDKPEESK